jgi:hypothetical protein
MLAQLGTESGFSCADISGNGYVLDLFGHVKKLVGMVFTLRRR